MGRNSAAIDASFSEVSQNPPKIVRSTLKKYGPERALKQRTAIALSKARKSGARVPNAKLNSGGKFR